MPPGTRPLMVKRMKSCTRPPFGPGRVAGRSVSEKTGAARPLTGRQGRWAAPSPAAWDGEGGSRMSDGRTGAVAAGGGTVRRTRAGAVGRAVRGTARRAVGGARGRAVGGARGGAVRRTRYRTVGGARGGAVGRTGRRAVGRTRRLAARVGRRRVGGGRVGGGGGGPRGLR